MSFLSPYLIHKTWDDAHWLDQSAKHTLHLRPQTNATLHANWIAVMKILHRKTIYCISYKVLFTYGWELFTFFVEVGKKITHKRDEKHAPHWRILYSNHNITWNMHEYCNDTFWILLYNNHNILGARMLWTASDAAACCSCDVGSSNYGNWAKARIINKIP